MKLGELARGECPGMYRRPEKRYGEALEAIEMLARAGFKAMLAGGCVRDRQLGIDPKDYDVATDAEPDKVCAIFKQKGIKVITTGIDHGTVTVIIGLDPIEITSLREDVLTDGRHAVVKFGRSFEEDARRRDFTINAMFEDENGKVYDYFGGLDDLKNGVLRFVGDPRKRIKEDYLRIMRLFRFWARFGFRPSEQTLLAVTELSSGLKRVSQERLTSELLQMLSFRPVAEIIETYVKTGVNKIVTPEAKDERVDYGLFVELDKIDIPRRDMAGLACLIKPGPSSKSPDALCSRLKLARRDAALLGLSLLPGQRQPCDPNEDDALGAGQLMEALDSFESKLVSPDRIGFGESGHNLFIDYLYPLWMILYPEFSDYWQRLFKIESSMGAKRRQPLPITGKDIGSTLQIQPGPELGLLLHYLKRSFRDGIWSTKEQGLSLLRQSDIFSIASSYLRS